jgi:DNA-binding NarL/FixJ family response regulator
MFVRILIVDDSHVIRESLRKQLEAHAGWEVCGESVNGQQAIEMADGLKPNLIVLDLSMPVMNGLQAAPVLKKLLPSTPIVMFTAFETDNLRELALAAGVTVLINKSKPAALFDTIRSLFPGQESKLRNSIA